MQLVQFMHAVKSTNMEPKRMHAYMLGTSFCTGVRVLLVLIVIVAITTSASAQTG